MRQSAFKRELVAQRSNVALQPRRFTIAASADGCKRVLCRVLRLWQRLEPIQWLVVASLFPQSLELPLMERCPFGDESHGTRRQLPRDERQAVDGDPSFVFSVFSVKVRGRVIGEVHLDDNAVEAADFRHEPT